MVEDAMIRFFIPSNRSEWLNVEGSEDRSDGLGARKRKNVNERFQKN